jgi:hypothetical protein
VVRNVIDGTLGDSSAWRARLGSGRVQLESPPHVSCLGHDERPLVVFLAAARTAVEIDEARLCPPTRADRLIAFLDAAGALAFDDGLGVIVGRAAAYALLELGEDAGVEEIKSAYRRLARALHPDAHPGASSDDLRQLEERFGQVRAAYRRLV